MDNNLTAAELELINDWLHATGKDQDPNCYKWCYYNRYNLNKAQEYFKGYNKMIRSTMLGISFIMLMPLVGVLLNNKSVLESDPGYRAKKEEVRQCKQLLEKKKAELANISDSLRYVMYNNVKNENQK